MKIKVTIGRVPIVSSMNTQGVHMRNKLLTIALALAPTILMAQGQPQDQTQSKAPQARIDAAVHAAAEAKIPTSLLTNKVAEGEAKHVPPERIANAVEARLKSLVRASAALSRADVQHESASELAVAADALEAGVTENALIRLTKSAPEERRVVAVAVLADLVRLGQSSDAAFAQVNAAVTTSAALANLNAQVASQLKLGGLSSTLDAAGIARVP
jgi:hypothetical protein